MKWKNHHAKDAGWHRAIKNRAQKTIVANKLALRLKNGDVIGAGSGSTSYLTLLALAKRAKDEGIDFWVIPTSIEIENVCTALGINTTQLSNQKPDWCFDGADEVDSINNLIKGRGGALLREKLVIAASSEVYIVVDESKQVQRLGQNYPVPVEVLPEAVQLVETSLQKLKGVHRVQLRQAIAKDGPLITEKGNLIFDVHFSVIVPGTEKALKAIVGVVESGLFMGYRITIV